MTDPSLVKTLPLATPALSPVPQARPATATPPVPSPRPAVDPAERLFREQVVAEYRRGAVAAPVVRLVRPAAWGYLVCLASLVLGAGALTAFGHLELSATARGALRGAERPASLVTEIAGVLSAVPAHEGDIVAADSELFQLDSTTLNAELIRAEARLSFAATKLQEIQQLDAALYADQVDLLNRNLGLAARRAKSAQASAAALKKQDAARDELWRQGLISGELHEVNQEQLRERERNLLDAFRDVASTGLDIRRTQLEQQRLLDQWRYEKGEAERALQATRLSLRQSVIRAPRRGRLEGVTVSVGQVLPAGALLGRVVPLERPTRATVFVAERDRAFLVPGAAVWFEVDRLPLGEFGALRGKLISVEKEPATSEELRVVLGGQTEADGAYAVSVALDDSAAAKALLVHLETGARVTAHIAMRRQRLAGLLFGPLRRWLQ